MTDLDYSLKQDINPLVQHAVILIKDDINWNTIYECLSKTYQWHKCDYIDMLLTIFKYFYKLVIDAEFDGNAMLQKFMTDIRDEYPIVINFIVDILEKAGKNIIFRIESLYRELNTLNEKRMFIKQKNNMDQLYVELISETMNQIITVNKVTELIEIRDQTIEFLDQRHKSMTIFVERQSNTTKKLKNKLEKDHDPNNLFWKRDQERLRLGEKKIDNICLLSDSITHFRSVYCEITTVNNNHKVSIKKILTSIMASLNKLKDDSLARIEFRSTQIPELEMKIRDVIINIECCYH